MKPPHTQPPSPATLFIGLLAALLALWFLSDLGQVIAGRFVWSYLPGFAPTIAPNGEYIPGKTIWDLLELLIVPLALALTAIWFNRQERSEERHAAERRAEQDRQAAALRAQEDRDIASQRAIVDREIAADRAREVALQSYLDKMTELLLDGSLRASAPDSEARTIARARTLSALASLDGKRKGTIIRFLAEAHLLSSDIISLEAADLSGVELSIVPLANVNLRRANLEKAHLDRVILINATLVNVNLKDAAIIASSLANADLSNSDLTNTDLTGTNLSNATLVDTSLIDTVVIDTVIDGLKIDRASLERLMYEIDESSAPPYDEAEEAAIEADFQARIQSFIEHERRQARLRWASEILCIDD